MRRQTKKWFKGDLNSMTIHISKKFEEHNYAQQGNPHPPIFFQWKIHIISVARMMRKWIWEYLQNVAGIFGQEIIVGILFIFPDVQLVPDTKRPTEVMKVTSGCRGLGCRLYPHFLITKCFCAVKGKQKMVIIIGIFKFEEPMSLHLDIFRKSITFSFF